MKWKLRLKKLPFNTILGRLGLKGTKEGRGIGECGACTIVVDGKAAIVGENGEREHAAAILHPKLGKPFRDSVSRGLALIPSAKKVGGMGTEIDVPINFKDAAFVRSHFDAMAVRVDDAPRVDEIVVALVVTDCGRPHPRIGGLKKEEAKMEDGLR